MTTFSFAGTAVADAVPELEVIRVRRPIVATRRDEFVDVPGRAGFWLFAEEGGARTLTIDVDILAASFEERRAAVVALADLLEQPGMSALIIDDEPDRFHLARLGNAPDLDEWLVHGAASIDFVCDPYSYATTPSTASYAPTSATPQPFTVPDTVHGIPVVEITANAGTIVGFELTLGGFTLVYAGTIASGATITINSIGYTITTGASIDTDLDGTFDPDDLSMTTMSGDFPIIDPGDNSLVFRKLAGTATSATVAIEWRRRSR